MKLTIKLTSILFILFCFNASAQTWVDKMQDSTENFYSIQQEFNNYWQNKPYERGKGYKAFRRWEWYMEPRVYPTGDLKFASRSKAIEEFQNYMIQNPVAAQKIQSANATSTTGNWTPMGPYGSPVGGDAGRVTFIRFMPGNVNTIFLGTGAGGLWVSTNNGSTWNTNTNSLEVLGCSDLAIDPVNTNIMYLATGDIDAGDTYATGILKSLDGGVTWSQTGLTWTVSSQRRIGRLLVNPLNPNILFAATSAGIYRTNNAGVTWAVVKSGNFKDIEYRPSDTSTVYAVTGSGFFRSTTGGNTSASFVQITSGISGASARMVVSVTPADPNYVYVLKSASDNSYGGVYRSTNSGTNFTLMSSTPNIFGWDPNGGDAGGQGWYDIACGVSPVDKDEITCGGVNSWKSLDGGVTWDLNTHWYGGGAPYVHADLHVVEYTSGTTCYLGHDGGISRTTNSGTSWTTINGQMNIAQSYRIGQSTTTANYVLSGHQDNGTNLLNGTTWTEVYGGDGADCFVDRTNNNTLVESYVNGDFNISNNAGASWSGITSGLTGTAAWIAPIIQSPHVANTYYCGYQQVFKSTNKGSSWTQMGTISASGQILFLAAAPSNSLVLYAATSGALYKTVNGGTNWTAITTGLPTGAAQITRMVVDNTDANNVFVTFSGYSAANKVFVTTDGGSTWSNISTGLPNLPVNCIIHTNNSNDEIYVGTDVGVYFKDGSMTAWMPFMTGLPNVVVNDFEIFYPTSKIRAGTYGRGIWESDLYSNPNSTPVANFTTAFASACVNIPFAISDQSSGMPTAWSWTLTGATTPLSSVKNPTVTYTAPGVYTVSLVSTNANGSSSVFSNTVNVISPPNITVTSGTVCPGTGSSKLLSASGASSYSWSTGSTSTFIVVSPATTTVYTVTGFSGACSSIQTTTVYVGSPVATPTISQNGNVLTSSSATSNQWYLNGSLISGATAQSYTVTQDGTYNVVVSPPYGCPAASSSTVSVIFTGMEGVSFVNTIQLSPNPAKDVIFVNSPVRVQKTFNYTIYSVRGQVVKNGTINLNANESIVISDLSAGTYEIKFNNDQSAAAYKFIKE
ncbi:MAG: T9SS type A sorting domain-containing protein [Bacteroidota bacterium]